VNSLIGCLHSALAQGIVLHDDVVEARNVPAAAIDRGRGSVTFAAASVTCLTHEQRRHYIPSRYRSKSGSTAIEVRYRFQSGRYRFVWRMTHLRRKRTSI
jgi:hypothetical protein